MAVAGGENTAALEEAGDGARTGAPFDAVLDEERDDGSQNREDAEEPEALVADDGDELGRRREDGLDTQASLRGRGRVGGGGVIKFGSA